jgi:hypothetical protein
VAVTTLSKLLGSTNDYSVAGAVVEILWNILDGELNEEAAFLLSDRVTLLSHSIAGDSPTLFISFCLLMFSTHSSKAARSRTEPSRSSSAVTC